MKKNKKIIVLEGIDGVGKSTQARLLYFALKKRASLLICTIFLRMETLEYL